MKKLKTSKDLVGKIIRYYYDTKEEGGSSLAFFGKLLEITDRGIFIMPSPDAYTGDDGARMFVLFSSMSSSIDYFEDDQINAQ